MNYGKGLILEPEEVIAAPARWLVGAKGSGAALIPDEYTMASYLTESWDQGYTARCVGFAIRRAIQLRTAYMGKQVIPSANGIYTLARCLDRPTLLQPLVDMGTMPSKAFIALMEWGLPTEEVWPSEAQYVDAEPSLDVLEYCSDTKVTGWYQIAKGDTEMIRMSLAQGYPVTFGAYVDEEFEKYTGGVVENMGDGGGHYMCLYGYKKTESGYIYRNSNSWGNSWGFNGTGMLSENFMSQCFSVYAMRVTQ